MGLVTFRSVNFTRKINVQAGNADAGWLIHELVHVSQMQALGAQYIFEALYAQHTSGYSYGGYRTLKAGHKLQHFNLEQQADIVRHYYQRALHGEEEVDVYTPYISALLKGEF